MSQLIKYVHKDNWLHWAFKIARLSDIACNCKSQSIMLINIWTACAKKFHRSLIFTTEKHLDCSAIYSTKLKLKYK